MIGIIFLFIEALKPMKKENMSFRPYDRDYFFILRVRKGMKLATIKFSSL